jgi:hypothetical protein
VGTDFPEPRTGVTQRLPPRDWWWRRPQGCREKADGCSAPDAPKRQRTGFACDGSFFTRPIYSPKVRALLDLSPMRAEYFQPCANNPPQVAELASRLSRGLCPSGQSHLGHFDVEPCDIGRAPRLLIRAVPSDRSQTCPTRRDATSAAAPGRSVNGLAACRTFPPATVPSQQAANNLLSRQDRFQFSST